MSDQFWEGSFREYIAFLQLCANQNIKVYMGMVKNLPSNRAVLRVFCRDGSDHSLSGAEQFTKVIYEFTKAGREINLVKTMSDLESKLGYAMDQKVVVEYVAAPAVITGVEQYIQNKAESEATIEKAFEVTKKFLEDKAKELKAEQFKDWLQETLDKSEDNKYGVVDKTKGVKKLIKEVSEAYK